MKALGEKIIEVNEKEDVLIVIAIKKKRKTLDDSLYIIII